MFYHSCLVLWATVCALAQTPAPDAQTVDLANAPAAVLLPYAEGGDAVAQYYLSRRYARGEGVAKDLVQAYKWALLTERNGISIFAGTAGLQKEMTEAQIAEAQKQADAFGAAAEPPAPAAVSQMNPDMAPEQKAAVFHFVAELEPFRVCFPSMPRRTAIQDNAATDAVYYQSLSADGSTQYTVSLQTFKTAAPQDQQGRMLFLKEYLSMRAMAAWKQKLQKKYARFRGYTAAFFRHKTLQATIEMQHEGIVFVTENAAICLLCVHPAQITPTPTFQEYIDSFEWLDTATH